MQKTSSTANTPAVANSSNSFSNRSLVNNSYSSKPATVLENVGSTDRIINQQFFTPALTTTASSFANQTVELPSKQHTSMRSTLDSSVSNPNKMANNILKESNTFKSQVIMCIIITSAGKVCVHVLQLLVSCHFFTFVY
jgi:hypothetical protein